MTIETIDTYGRILALLDSRGITFDELEHVPEGRTDLASVIRGNDLVQAAKAMVLKLKGHPAGPPCVLAVVPGDRRINFDAVARLTLAHKASFASPEEAEAVTRCAMGAVPPLSFDERLRVIVDERVVENDRVIFNAGRLDRSIWLTTRDYLRIADAQVARISA